MRLVPALGTQLPVGRETCPQTPPSRACLILYREFCEVVGRKDHGGASGI